MRLSSCRIQRCFLFCIVTALGLASVAHAQNSAGRERRERSSARGRDAQAPRWLQLKDYPRPPAPDTGWGIHDNPNCTWKPDNLDAFFRELRERLGICWFKVLACGGNKLDVVQAARRNGVEPVVRLYVDRPAPHYPREGQEEAEFRRLVRAYVQAGAHYIESGNEPNLSLEWAGDTWQKGLKEGTLIQQVCEQWLRVKPMIQQEGGIPVFYAMSPGGEDGRSQGQWWEECFKYLQEKGKIEEAFAGAAFGAHLGPLNHPLDYPFDKQRNMPHATKEERIQSLMQNNTCYLAVELLIYQMEKYLPSPIPILSTEGGAFTDNHDDKSYPKVTPEVHRDLNLGMLQRFNPKHPEYWGDPLFSQMSWIWWTEGGIFAIDSWYNNPKYGHMPILAALEKEPRFDRGAALGAPEGRQDRGRRGDRPRRQRNN